MTRPTTGFSFPAFPAISPIPTSFLVHTMSRPIQLHNLPFSTTSAAAIAITANTSTAPSLPKSYIIQPPIKPWPHRLHPKLVASLSSRQHDPNLSLQIFLHAENHHRPPFSHNPQTYQSIFLKLSRARRFAEIESLLSSLRNSPHLSEIRCGEEPIVTVIRGYGLAGKPIKALRTFLKMKSLGIRPSVRSVNGLLNSLVHNRRYGLAHLVFKNCRDRFRVLPNVVSCNILLKALCKGNEVENAVRVLDEMYGMGFVNIVKQNRDRESETDSFLFSFTEFANSPKWEFIVFLILHSAVLTCALL